MYSSLVMKRKVDVTLKIYIYTHVQFTKHPNNIPNNDEDIKSFFYHEKEINSARFLLCIYLEVVLKMKTRN